MNKLILPMQSVDVNSTAISTAQYEYNSYRLKLTFTNGRSYNYKRVPNHVFEGLRISSSKGKFINKYVLPVYPFDHAQMTDDQLNDLAAKIADSIFKRLIDKQREWDEQFNDQMTEVSWGQMEYKEEDALRAKYKELNEELQQNLIHERYSKCEAIQKELVKLENQLKKFK